LTALRQATLDTLCVQAFQNEARYTPGLSEGPTVAPNIFIRLIACTTGADTAGVYIDDSTARAA